MRFKRIVVDICSQTPPSWASIPYQDPRLFDPTPRRRVRPKGIAFKDVPKVYMDRDGMKTFWEFIRLSNQEDSAFHADDDDHQYYLNIGIANSLFSEGSMAKVPRFIQAALRTKKTVSTLEQCLRVAQNAEFVPMPKGQKRG